MPAGCTMRPELPDRHPRFPLRHANWLLATYLTPSQRLRCTQSIAAANWEAITRLDGVLILLAGILNRSARSNRPGKSREWVFRPGGAADLGCRTVDVQLRCVIPVGGTDGLIVVDHKDCWRFGVQAETLSTMSRVN